MESKVILTEFVCGKVVDLVRLFEEINSKLEKPKAEVEEIRAHAVQLLKMCVNLKKRIVTLANFTSNKDIALYSRFCSSAVFMAMYIIFIWKKVRGTADFEDLPAVMLA